MRNEETDLSFVEFGDPKWPYTAPRNKTELEEVANYLNGAPGGIRRLASLACRIRICGGVDGSP
jgi:hypothetical protein